MRTDFAIPSDNRFPDRQVPKTEAGSVLRIGTEEVMSFLRSVMQNARKPDGIAGRLMLWGMNWGHASQGKWGRGHVSPAPDAHGLDIGCGGGANLAQLLKTCPKGRVCGIDFSAESVALSRRKNAGAVAPGGARCGGGTLPGSPMPPGRLISSPPLKRYPSGRTCPPLLSKSAAWPVRRVADRQRGVRRIPLDFHGGRDAVVYRGHADGMAARRRVRGRADRCPQGRGVVPRGDEGSGLRIGPVRTDLFGSPQRYFSRSASCPIICVRMVSMGGALRAKSLSEPDWMCSFRTCL